MGTHNSDGQRRGRPSSNAHIGSKISSLTGASKLLARREINELPNILWEDEELEKIVQGTYANGTGVVVATNKRLVFVNKGMLCGLKVEDFPYDKISSIQYETGMILGKLTIFTSVCLVCQSCACVWLAP